MRNQSHASFDTTTTFTKHLKGIAHVDTQYSEVYGEGLDTPMGARGNYANDVMALVKHLKAKIGDSATSTNINPFQGIAGVDISLGDYRKRKPWTFIKAVSEGKSAPYGYNNPQSWQKFMQHYLDDCMYKK